MSKRRDSLVWGLWVLGIIVYLHARISNWTVGFDNPDNVCKNRGTGSVLDNARATMQVIADVREMSEEILGDPNAFVLNFGEMKPDIQIKEAGDDDKDS